MFNIMICNITKIRIRLSICTSSEVVLSSIVTNLPKFQSGTSGSETRYCGKDYTGKIVNSIFP